MFCKNCGTQIEDDAKFCYACGTIIDAGTAAQQPSQYASPYQSEPQQQQGSYYAPPVQNAQPNYYAQQQYPNTMPVAPQKDKMVAGLLGIFLGALGIHKFYLGYTKPAVIMLLVSVIGSILTFGVAAGVMSIIGLVEGIIYLTHSNEDFYNTYEASVKEWF